MSKNRLSISRRKALAALGVVGGASAGTGFATSAYFSDQESFENNALVAGELDATVAYSTHYSDWSPDEDGGSTDDAADDVAVRMYDGVAGETGIKSDLQAGETGLPSNDAWLVAVDDPAQFLTNIRLDAAGDATCPDGTNADELSQPVVELDDVKPGDFGTLTLEFALCDNPGFVWLNGTLRSAAENGTTEPEADDPDEGAGVELLDAVQTAVWIDDGNGYQDGGEEPVLVGSLRQVLSQLPAAGRPPGGSNGGNAGTVGNAGLVGDLPAAAGGGSGRNCFSAETTHAVVFAWWLPVDHANEIQTDTAAFTLGLYTEQCRHNNASAAIDGLETFASTTATFDASGETLVIEANGAGMYET